MANRAGKGVKSLFTIKLLYNVNDYASFLVHVCCASLSCGGIEKQGKAKLVNSTIKLSNFLLKVFHIDIRRKLFKTILNELGLKDDEIKRNVLKLSGGQQQRVAIGRAILAHTDIILADEPTGNLDGENAENVMDILKALNKEGKTIVLVTHDLKIANYADRIIRLEQGKIV